MRRFLLWMARNQWLRERVPRLAFVRRSVRRFMPGEELADALAAAQANQAVGVAAVFTRLGENLVSLDEAQQVADHYHGALDAIAGVRLDAEISVKVSQLGYDLDVEAAFRHLAGLARHAAETGTWLWFDMEGSAYVEGTIQLYERVRAAYPNVGLCLQAYLHRTPADVQRLLPLQPAIRLVKGAYDEPAAIALRTRREVDAAFLAIASTVAPAIRDGTLRFVAATHDVALLEQLARFHTALGLEPARTEIQMLYGIRPDEQRRLAARGFTVRCLVAYGEHWYAWYLRRLAERPANVVFALRQILPG